MSGYWTKRIAFSLPNRDAERTGRLLEPVSFKMKILFILNPHSGANSNDKAVLRIHELAVQRDFDFKFLYTKGNTDDKRIQQTVAEYRPDRVVAGGGDGTIQLVARNLIGTGIPMGLLPLGSANGMATALGFPVDPVTAVDTIIASHHTLGLDLLKFNNKNICVHVGDIGINALMVKKYGLENTKGMLGYARHLISSIKESPLLKYKIHTPEETIDKEGYMLAFANGHKYGTGVHISQGKAWDGKFEICNVPQIALDDAIKSGLTILNVFIDSEMFTDVISCTEAEVEISRKVHFQIDGEYMGKTNHLKVNILPSAVKLLVP